MDGSQFGSEGMVVDQKALGVDRSQSLSAYEWGDRVGWTLIPFLSQTALNQIIQCSVRVWDVRPRRQFSKSMSLGTTPESLVLAHIPKNPKVYIYLVTPQKGTTRDLQLL